MRHSKQRHRRSWVELLFNLVFLFVVFVPVFCARAEESRQSVDSATIAGRDWAKKIEEMDNHVSRLLSGFQDESKAKEFLESADLLFWWDKNNWRSKISARLLQLSTVLHGPLSKRLTAWGTVLEFIQKYDAFDRDTVIAAIKELSKSKKVEKPGLEPVRKSFERARIAVSMLPPGDEKNLLIGVANIRAARFADYRGDASAAAIALRLVARQNEDASRRTAPVLIEALARQLQSSMEQTAPLNDQLAKLNDVVEYWQGQELAYPVSIAVDPTIALAALQAANVKLARSALVRATKFLEGFGKTTPFGLVIDGLKEVGKKVGDYGSLRDLELISLREKVVGADTASDEWADSLYGAFETDLLSNTAVGNAVLLSAIAASPDIAPENSPAWRRVTFELAEAIDQIGSQPAAIQVRARAAKSPLPRAAETALKTETDPQRLIDLAKRFQHDLGVKAAVTKAAFEKLELQRDANPTKDLHVGTEAALAFIRIGQPQDGAQLLLEFLGRLQSRNLTGAVRREVLPTFKLSSSLFEDLGNRTYASQLRLAVFDFGRTDMISEIAQSTEFDTTALIEIRQLGNDLFEVDRPADAIGLWVDLYTSVLERARGSPDVAVNPRLIRPIIEGLGTAFSRTQVSSLGSSINNIADGISPFTDLNVTSICSAIKHAISIAARENQLISVTDKISSMACPGYKPDLAQDTWSGEQRRLQELVGQAPIGTAPSANFNDVDRLVEGASQKAKDGELDAARALFLAALKIQRDRQYRNSVSESHTLLLLADTYRNTQPSVLFEIKQDALDTLLNDGAFDTPSFTELLRKLLQELSAAGRRTDAVALVARVGKALEGQNIEQPLASILTPFQQMNPLDSVKTPFSPEEIAALSDQLSKEIGDSRDQLILRTLGRISSIEPGYANITALVPLLTKLDQIAATAQNPVIKISVPMELARFELVNGTLLDADRNVDRALALSVSLPRDSIELFSLYNDLKALRGYAASRDGARTALKLAASDLKQVELKFGPRSKKLLDSLQNGQKLSLQAGRYSTYADLTARVAALEFDILDRANISAEVTRDTALEFAVGTLRLSCQPATLILFIRFPIRECAQAGLSVIAARAAEILRNAASDEVHFRNRDDGNPNGNSELESLLDLAEQWSLSSGPSETRLLEPLLVLTELLRQGPVGRAALAQADKGGLTNSTEFYQAGRYAWSERVWLDALVRTLASRSSSDAKLAANDLELLRLGAADTGGPEDDKRPTFSFDTSQLRAALATNEAVVLPVMMDDAIYCWIINHDRLAVRRSRRNKMEFLKDLNFVLRSADLNVRQVAEAPVRFPVGAAYRLYQDLLGPLEADLTGIKTIFLAPDASTARVPFPALVYSLPDHPTWAVEDPWTPNWAIQKYNFATVPSLRAFAALRRGWTALRPRNLLAVGDPELSGPSDNSQPIFVDGLANPLVLRGLQPLVGADEELKRAAKAMSGVGADLLQRGDLTERTLRHKDLSKFGALLFATHSVAQTQDSDSFLLATPPPVPSSEDDGVLTPPEISQLVLDADVVILSACSTGVSGDARGGFSDILAAFFFAGARMVVATSWSIASPTAADFSEPLMTSYARNGAALIVDDFNTRIRLLASESNMGWKRHPSYWSGVTLVGVPPMPAREFH
jgi:CHAT domain-containing protein